MKIQWLGHSCFCIELKSGTHIITDPYQPGAFSGALKYMPQSCRGDIVTVSHHHTDHDFVDGVPGAVVVDQAKNITIKDVVIETVCSYHDDQEGAERGENIIFLMKADSMTLAHFGDLGTLDLDYSRLGGIDIAFIPVGGTFTIDHAQADTLIERLRPKIVIPMHYKTPKLDFNIDTVDVFISDKDNVEKLKHLSITDQTLPVTTKIVVLDPQR